MQAATDVRSTHDGQVDELADELVPDQAPFRERIRKLPEALLLAAGYYGSRVRVLRELLDRRD
jgi:hypothetical protein